MNIGIIGSGNVGGALGTRWAGNGHPVVFGTRSPQSDDIQKLLAAAGAQARAGSFAEAAAASDVILLATPWNAVMKALASAGDLAGKIIIDATNPLLPDLSGLAIGNATSAAEQIAQGFPGAHVVKAFNTVGSNVMADSSFKEGRAAMFYCGDDQAAKQTVASLIHELGFEAIDAGPLTQARLLEPFALLWISLALKQGHGRNIAFELLRR